MRVLIAAVACVVSLLAGPAFAQDLRFYVLPKAGDGSILDPYHAKYLSELGVVHSAMDYGKEDAMLAGALVTTEQHTDLASNIDVTAIPQNLDAKVSAAALATIQTKLEDWKIPGDWVTTNHTYRHVVGVVGRCFLLMQRFDGINAATFFASGITLDTRMNQLTGTQRTNLQNAAASMGLETAFVTSTMTVRTVLKTWIAAMGSFALMGETF